MKQNMQNTLKYAAIIGLALTMLMLTISNLQAQVDDNRMQQDLGIMKKFLVEWFKSGNPAPDQLYMVSHTVSARYTPDFGILLRTPRYSTSRTAISTGDFIYRYNYRYNYKKDWEKSDAKEEDRMDMKAIEDSVLRLMQGFLAAYGDLAGQLPEDEKVMLIYGQENAARTISFSSSGNYVGIINGISEDDQLQRHGNMSVSIDKKSLDDFRANRISESNLFDRMNIIKAAFEEEIPMEFKVFGGVLKDIVRVDNFDKELREENGDEDEDITVGWDRSVIALGSSANSRLSFEYLEGYGVVYQLNPRTPFTRPFVVGSGRDQIRIDSDHLSVRYSDNWVDKYAELVTQELKRALVDYGRTLRKLKQGEWLVVLLDLPACESCDAPSQIELKVPQNVLEQYDMRKINLDTAIDRIDIRAIGKASDKKEDFPVLFNDRWKNDDE